MIKQNAIKYIFFVQKNHFYHFSFLVSRKVYSIVFYFEFILFNFLSTSKMKFTPVNDLPVCGDDGRFEPGFQCSRPMDFDGMFFKKITKYYPFYSFQALFYAFKKCFWAMILFCLLQFLHHHPLLQQLFQLLVFLQLNLPLLQLLLFITIFLLHFFHFVAFV
jgi:hypothetical protein